MAVLLQTQEHQVIGLVVEHQWALVMVVVHLHGELQPGRLPGHRTADLAGMVVEHPLGKRNRVHRLPMEARAT